ncbi:hypothetical protein E1189_21385 [Sansalvadorimonas verongulae]|nr:hypothetical protein [Sansalvadorimonas verongulae]
MATSGSALSWIAWPVAFAAGCMLFAFRIVAGGDIKLALALLLGIDAVWWPTFFFITAVSGGLLAIGYLVFACINNTLPQLRQRGIPYGVPIALAGVCGVWLTAVDYGLLSFYM